MLIAGTFTLVTGFLIRLWAVGSPYLTSIINQNEIVSPLTSWKRVTEGLYLKRHGTSPYDGDVFHQSPIMLAFVDYLEQGWNRVVPQMFVLFDVIAAVLIGLAARETGRFMLLLQQKSRPNFHKDCDESKLLTDRSFKGVFVYAAAMYLFNPYSLAACIAKSTAVFDNIIMAYMIVLTLKGWRFGCTLLLALLAYQNFYSIMLIVPVALCLVQRDMLGVVRYTSWKAVSSISLTVILTAMWLTSLLYYSEALHGSWDFLRSTYGFMLNVPELTPNMGVFWYFFTEMFAHFEQFFLIVFQVNAFIYTIPLAIKLRHHPAFLLYALIVIMAIFKSYPTYADVGFYLALLPCWSFATSYMRNTFIVTNMYVWCAILSPIFYHLWIYSGSANANFYFALSLVSLVAQIFFISDLMFAYLRRDFDLYHPLPTEAQKDDNNKNSSSPSKDGSGQQKTNQTPAVDNVILQ